MIIALLIIADLSKNLLMSVDVAEEYEIIDRDRAIK